MYTTLELETPTREVVYGVHASIQSQFNTPPSLHVKSLQGCPTAQDGSSKGPISKCYSNYGMHTSTSM